MKCERSGIGFLLTILMVFSITVGFLHGDRPSALIAPASKLQATSGFVGVGLDEVMVMLTPLIASHSVEKLVESLRNMPHDQTLAMVQRHQ